MRFVVCGIAALFAGAAFSQELPEWQSVIVRFTIDADGKLHIAEQVQVDVPASVTTLERTYWSDAEQRVVFESLTLDGNRIDFQTPSDGRIVWSVPRGRRSLTYVIESTVTDGVIPAWSIPRGNLSHGGSGQVDDPRRRLRRVLPIWREAKKNRYLLDYQFEMPPPSTQGTTTRLQLYWADAWKPVHEITPGTIAKAIDRDTWNPNRWRVTHLFDYRGNYDYPVSVDVPRHAIRMGALIGFPVVALLLWLLFVIREVLRRGLAGGDSVDEQFVRENVYSEAPEVVAARWSGETQFPSIEKFLRRLERERKIALVIEDAKEEDEEPTVSLRLLVPRDRLTAYERAGIDALIPSGWETSSEDIRQRYSGQDFDPLDALQVALAKVTAAAKKSTTSPWYSRLTSFLVFGAGVMIALQESVRLGREPAVLGAALVVSSVLIQWPRGLTRNAIRGSLLGTLILLIPLVLAFAVIVFIFFAAEIPPGMFASAGLSLMLLGVYKVILAGSATRDADDVRQLARARLWLRRELKSSTPRLRDESIPWLTALGLGRDIDRWRRRNQSAETRFASASYFTGMPPPEEDEEWGGAADELDGTVTERFTAALRRDLGTLESYAALIGILIGAGIFKVTSYAWELTGPSVILAYVVLAPAILATSAAYSVFLSTPLGREPGGEYTHLSRTFHGYGVAFIGAWLQILSYIGALAFLASTFADYLIELFGGAVPKSASMLIAVASLLFFYAIHVAGVRWFGRLQVWMCALLGLSLVVLIVPGLFAIRPENYRPFFTKGLGGFAESLPPLFFAYAGFEALAQTAGEVRDSTKKLPRIFFRGILATSVIYILMSVVAFGVMPGEQLRTYAAPMAAVASKYLPFGAAWFVTFGAVMALSTSVNATMLVPSRIGVMLAEDGLAPAWIGAVSPKTGTPITGLTLTLVAALLLLATGKVYLTLNIAVLALVVLYFLHSIALIYLPITNKELYRSVTLPMSRGLQILCAVLSILAMGTLIVLLVQDADTMKLMGFWGVIGAVLFLIARRSHPRKTYS